MVELLQLGYDVFRFLADKMTKDQHSKTADWLVKNKYFTKLENYDRYNAQRETKEQKELRLERKQYERTRRGPKKSTSLKP